MLSGTEALEQYAPIGRGEIGSVAPPVELQRENNRKAERAMLAYF
jgi:hypothetical protein